MIQLSHPYMNNGKIIALTTRTFVCKVMFLLFVVIQLISPVHLFDIPWTEACQTFLSFTMSWSLLKLMSIESVMPSNHFVHCHPLLLLPSVFPSIRVFSNQLVKYSLQVATVLELQLQHQSFQWIFRIDFLNQVAKVLEHQLQHWSFQWIFRIDFL